MNVAPVPVIFKVITLSPVALPPPQSVVAEVAVVKLCPEGPVSLCTYWRAVTLSVVLPGVWKVTVVGYVDVSVLFVVEYIVVLLGLIVFLVLQILLL